MSGYTQQQYKRQRDVSGSANLGKLSSFVTASVQPFADHAQGAKVPDENMLPSVTASFKQSEDLSVDAAGYAARICRADMDDCFVTPNGATPINASTGAIDWANGSGVINGTDIDGAATTSDWIIYRVVGAGVRIKYQGTLDDAQGNLTICQGADYNSTVEYGYNCWPQTENEFEKAPGSVQMTVSKLAQMGEVSLPFLTVDSTAFDYRYINPGRVGDTDVLGHKPTKGWSYIGLYVDGALADAKFDVDLILHVELIPRLSNLSALHPVTPAAPFRQDVMRLVKGITNDIQHQVIHKGGEYENHLRDEVSGMLDTGMKLGKDLLVQGGQYLATRAVPFIEEALTGLMFL